MELRCIIVDDEPPALDLLEDYVRRTPFLKLEARCSSGVEALQVLRSTHIDVAFMDIQMPQINGLELSRMADGCAIVFTTAFERYAIEGYKVEAVDYLLKPFSYAEFLSAADKAAKRVSLTAAAERNNTPVADSSNIDTQPYNIVIKANYKQMVVDTRDITFIESERDYVRIHREDGSQIQTLINMKNLEEILPHDKFIRVHRSYIVNVDKVKTIDRGRIVFAKTYIPITESYRDTFERLFGSLLLNS